MAVDVEYMDGGGKQRKFVLEEGDDTNLLLGGPKSAFTLVRSHYVDESGDTQHEFWAKVPHKTSRMITGGKLYRDATTTYPEVSYSTRPSSRPKKLVFDSDRTAIADCFDANYSSTAYDTWRIPTNINDTVGCWAYIGSSADLADKDFTLNGYLITNDGFGFRGEESEYDESLDRERYFLGDIDYDRGRSPSSFMFIAEKSVGDRFFQDKKNGIFLNPYWIEDSEDYYDVVPEYFSQYPVLSYEEWDAFGVDRYWAAAVEWHYEIVFSGKVAEVRDWEIVSNDTPEENTYYVVVKNKKGDIVDVVTTHGFGQTVNVGGKDYVVKYDMVIRPGR